MNSPQTTNNLTGLASEITLQQMELIDLLRKVVETRSPAEVQLAIAEALRGITYAAGLIDARIDLINAERDKLLAELNASPALRDSDRST